MCRGSKGGLDRPKARYGRFSHTVDSESGPGGLKARCGRTSYIVDSRCMVVLCLLYDMVMVLLSLVFWG